MSMKARLLEAQARAAQRRSLSSDQLPVAGGRLAVKCKPDDKNRGVELRAAKDLEDMVSSMNARWNRQ